MTKRRLLLFDIDGTLVNTGGAGIVSLRKIVRERFGAEDDLHDIEFAGKTDRTIISDILRKYKTQPSDQNIDAFGQMYLAGLAEALPHCRGRILPGVAQLLTLLEKEPLVVLGLLTGNFERGAQLKLRHYGLWQYFEFGAFADDHHDRNELGAFAHRRAQEKHGHSFDFADIDVIGDTGHDIACGKAVGARTIAVATGGWSRERLAEARPDFLFDDLSQIDTVLVALGWKPEHHWTMTNRP